MANPIPSGSIDRIELALTKALALLPGDARAKLSALTDPSTLLGFAVVLGVWGGLQLTPFGVAADALLSAWGLLSLGAAAVELVRAAMAAAESETETQLDASAARLSKALIEVGIDLIAMVIANPVFKAVKKGAEAVRGTLKGAQVVRGTSPIAEIASAPPVVAGTGVVNAAPVVGSGVVKVLKIGIPVVAGLGLLAVLLARSGERKARRAFR